MVHISEPCSRSRSIIVPRKAASLPVTQCIELNDGLPQSSSTFTESTFSSHQPTLKTTINASSSSNCGTIHQQDWLLMKALVSQEKRKRHHSIEEETSNKKHDGRKDSFPPPGGFSAMLAEAASFGGLSSDNPWEVDEDISVMNPVMDPNESNSSTGEELDDPFSYPAPPSTTIRPMLSKETPCCTLKESFTARKVLDVDQIAASKLNQNALENLVKGNSTVPNTSPSKNTHQMSYYSKPIQPTENNGYKTSLKPARLPENTIPKNTISGIQASPPLHTDLEITEAFEASIEAPAALAPYESVSPRTRTVQIPTNVSLNIVETPYTESGSTITKKAPIQPPLTQTCKCTVAAASMNSPSHSASPAQPTVIPSSPVAATTYSKPAAPSTSDIVRKPSLYKVPAWCPPIPEPSAGTTSSPAPKVQMPTITSTPLPAQTTQNITTTHRLDQQHKSAERPLLHDLTSPHSSLHATTRGTKPPTPKSQTPHNKHSPNLQVFPPRLPSHPITASLLLCYSTSSNSHQNSIVDIAETCQATLPFAAIAARHNVPLQKVYDTFSAAVQLPLLRHAVDNRRHGSLAKLRVREFREARRRMENDDRRKA